MSEHARWATDQELAEWWAEHTPSRTPLDARVTIVISDLRASLALITEVQDAVEHQRGMYEREHNTVHELQQRITNAMAIYGNAGSIDNWLAKMIDALTGKDGTNHG